MEKPNIYVASLADYNAGRLHGVHITLDGKDADAIWAEINAMLKKSREPGAEEWAIHDHEGFGSWHLSEYASIETLGLISQALVNASEDDDSAAMAFMPWMQRVVVENRTSILDMYNDNPDGLWEAFTGEYMGNWASWQEYVTEDDIGLEYLGYDALLQVAKKADEEEAWHHVDHDSKNETLLERLLAFVDWERVARDMEVELYNYHTAPAPEPVYGIWIYRDDS